MKCEEFEARMPDLLTGDLPEGEKAACDAHAAACDACRGQFQTIGEIWTKLGALPIEKPSPAARDRFYAMLESYQEGLRAEPARSVRRTAAPWFGRFWARRPAFGLAAALLLVAAGLGAGYGLSGAGRKAARLEGEVEGMRQALAASLLSLPSPADRIQGVNTSALVKRPDAGTLDMLLRTLDSDPNVNVRLAAADALFLFAGQPGVKEGIVASLARQTSPILQVALIDLLVEIREKRAGDALKALVGSPGSAPEVKKRAEQGLKELGL